MSELDLTTALGRLLTDRRLREALAADPARVADELSVRRADRAAFVALDRAGLEKHAQGLIDKRCHEVSRLLPGTMAAIGDNAPTLFGRYAEHHWPRGHKRHLLDAIEFCEWLAAGGENVCRAEYNTLRFSSGGKKFAIRLVADLPTRNGSRRAIQLLYRNRRGAMRQIAFHLV